MNPSCPKCGKSMMRRLARRGPNAGNYFWGCSGYPDCRDAFVKSLNVTLNLAMAYDFVIQTPLMWLDKAETWALADQLGAFDYVREKTLTCYNGIIGTGCGECPACHLRQRGLEKYLAERGEA